MRAKSSAETGHNVGVVFRELTDILFLYRLLVIYLYKMCMFKLVQIPVDQPVDTNWLTKPVNGVLKRRHSLSSVHLVSFLSVTEQQKIWPLCFRSGETVIHSSLLSSSGCSERNRDCSTPYQLS